MAPAAVWRGADAPPTDVLQQQVLERLITLRLQTARAAQTGVRVSDEEVDQAIAAMRSALDLAEPGGLVAYVTCSPHRAETAEALLDLRRHAFLFERLDLAMQPFDVVFLAAPDDIEAARQNKAPLVELTYNWDEEKYGEDRHFGHLAYEVDDIYATCEKLQKGGVTINRPPRDGNMAFVRSPDLHSIELLQKGKALPPKEPWTSMPNTGRW